MAATNQKREDYCDKLFDVITKEGDRRQAIDDGIKTEDIFIDDDYFLMAVMHTTQKICDYVLDDVNQNDILFKTRACIRHPKLPLHIRTSINIFRYFTTKKQGQGKGSQKNKK